MLCDPRRGSAAPLSRGEPTFFSAMGNRTIDNSWHSEQAIPNQEQQTSPKDPTCTEWRGDPHQEER